MSAVEKLFQEHRLIERVVSALEACANSVQGDSEQSRSDLLRFVTFFREFADLMHHEKEEEFLMPALVEAGLNWEEGLMLQIRKEHDFERHLLQTLRHLALQFGAWSADDCRRVIDISERFVKFMRNHIALEDGKLHQLIGERLTADAQAKLEVKLHQFDAKREVSGEMSLLLNLGEQLATRHAPRALP